MAVRAPAAASLLRRAGPIGVCRGHSCADVLAPLREPGLKGFDSFCLLSGEVVLLPEIGFEIEEFDTIVFEPFDKLPVAFAHTAGRCAALIAVMRVMPEERAGGQLAAAQHRHETHAVHVRP